MTKFKVKTVQLSSGEHVPAFGMGTWKMGEDPAAHAEELATLRLGLDLGANLIDTAEMYGSGLSEKLVGEAIAGRRDEVFLVTKVLPQNATRKKTLLACEKSLQRLGTEHIDLYLLHWRGSVPLAETIEAFKLLQEAGKIRHFGVSNFDVEDMRQLHEDAGGGNAQVNQVLYNLSRRGIEWDLLPWLHDHNMPVMAYSPIEEARLLKVPELKDFAQRYEMKPAQVALSWLLSRENVIVIPKTSQRERLVENLESLEHPLTAEQLSELDHLFPPPDGPQPLEMI